jgi:large subunit ribosomal protein L21
MYAVIEDRTRQYRVAVGDRVQLDLLDDAEPGSTVTFDQVCVLGGDASRIGTPFITGASVTATVVGEVKGPKLVVAKFRRRKNSRRRTGFRGKFTEVQIEAING